MDTETSKEILAELKTMNGLLNAIAIALSTSTAVQLCVNDIKFDFDRLSSEFERIMRDQAKRHG